MKIRFRIESEMNTKLQERTNLVISINCTASEMVKLAIDMNTFDNDNIEEPTAQLLEAINIMSGKKDFVYESEPKVKNKTKT